MKYSKYELDILNEIYKNGYSNQRIISNNSGYSLGLVNKCVNKLKTLELIDNSMKITNKANKLLIDNKPRNAIILAAGYGMRMAPINLTTPKALLEVKNETIIERQIRYLHDVGITDITIVVGFMKDSFEYLIDQYGVELVYNSEYAKKNNLYSLKKVCERISNTYIIPSDIWCGENPFSEREMYSWYMVSEKYDQNSKIRVNRKQELVHISDFDSGNRMIGISYLTKEDSLIVSEKIQKLSCDSKNDNSFWELALFDSDKMFISAKVVKEYMFVEINTYEDLRELDSKSNQLKSDAIDVISKTFNCMESDIMNIEVLKKGMTNRSFCFSVNNEKYIMRIPGEGTDLLINRKNEADVFETIKGYGLCDNPVYLNPNNGYKITKYLNEVHNCDCMNQDDLKKCMSKLKYFHELNLSVNHTFDIFSQIDYYESLWCGNTSIYKDYNITKENVLSLKSFVDEVEKEWCLTHIDAVPDNFLFYRNSEGEEELQLTDWEYSGMQDPHVDIAMFCIYSMYDRRQVDELINIYFEGDCDKKTKTKIYCYIAMCGLLWSNWCEYKRNLGVEFGEYSIAQYRYAKNYYKYATEMM